MDDVSPLENYKGRIANHLNIILDINHSDHALLKTLQQLKPEGRKGTLTITLVDSESKQHIEMRSRRQIPIDKELIDLLTGLNVQFTVSDMENV